PRPDNRVPQLEGALDHLGVDAIGTVDRPDDTRASAGARQSIARTAGVDQRDTRAAATQMERRPAAERPGADNDDALRRGKSAAGERSRRETGGQKLTPADQ